MLTFLLWAAFAVFLFSVARGLTQDDVSARFAGITWITAIVIFGGALTYCDPMAKERQDASEPTASDADRRLMAEAMRACDERTRQAASIPRTVDFKTFQTSRQVDTGRLAQVRRGFSAENAFGQTIDFIYQCDYQSGQIQAFNIYRE